jgi:hypothetical protein
MPLHPPSVSDTNITITASVTRTTALDPVNQKIVTIDPDLSEADRIFRLSFGIFIGLSDPDLNGFLVPELPLFLLL